MTNAQNHTGSSGQLPAIALNGTEFMKYNANALEVKLFLLPLTLQFQDLC